MSGAVRTYVASVVGGQRCGIDVRDVRDVLAPRRMTAIPLAPREVAGALNLRGRIVTAIDLRARLAVPAGTPAGACMSIVVERDGELYSLIVDEIGDVVEIPDEGVEPVPPALGAAWRRVGRGVCRLDDGPMVVLDIAAVLDLAAGHRAA